MAPSKKIILRRQVLADAEMFPEEMHPVLRRVYSQRQLSDPSQLNLGLSQLLPVSLLSGTQAAAALLYEKIVSQRRILILADFDADGATSCALAVRGLRAMGAENIDYLVPDRFRFGYGLTPEILQVALQYSPDLLITVDNGISSIEGVAAAREAGLQVLITDHHLPGSQLPSANVIVNPNLTGDSFPSKNLAGVGVVFYLLAAVRRFLEEKGWFEHRGIAVPNIANFLDLVALGTVADVVLLDHNNRILVHQGLARIRAGRCCAGIDALIGISGRNRGSLVASDLGFALGPRLNAAGRLESMSHGIECLLTDDKSVAASIAMRLDALNLERRSIEQKMQQEAVLDMESLVPDKVPPLGICLYRQAWHQGVIGILAARIREHFHRPVIAFAGGEQQGILKGSARSVSGLHIRDVLDSIASRHPGLLEKFGGHAMAAGLSLAQSDLDRFSVLFDQEVRSRLGEEDLRGVIFSDGELKPGDMGIELAEKLRYAGPWGQGFAEPVFDGEFTLVSQRVVAERHLKLQLMPALGKQLLDGIGFGLAEDHPRLQQEKIHIAYRLGVNEYRGTQALQLLIEHIEN